jgi:hypothetical protein
MDALNFDVTYRFSEYRQFALEHVRAVKGVSPGLFGRILISITATIVLAIKRLKMPRCSFTIDQTGIRRRTAGGEYVVPWARVRRVLRCNPGYVIELEHGAMPIPYRCLGENQRATLETLLRTNGKSTI